MDLKYSLTLILHFVDETLSILDIKFGFLLKSVG